MNLKKRLVEDAVRDLKLYVESSPTSKRMSEVRKAAAEALAFIVTPRCKAICREIGINYETDIMGFVKRNARHPAILKQFAA